MSKLEVRVVDRSTVDLVKWAKYFNGGAVCVFRPEGVTCQNPARWMPVLVMVAVAHLETDHTRVPVALYSAGVCDSCKDRAGASLGAKHAPALADRIGVSFMEAGLAPVRFDRVEWAQIASVA